MKSALLAFLLIPQPAGLDELLKQIFNGPGPSVVLTQYKSSPHRPKELIVCYDSVDEDGNHIQACIG